jgi:uncharacterized protein (TIGR02646 family)
MRRLTRAACPPAFLPLAESEFASARLYFGDPGRQDGFEFKAYSHGDVKTALSKMTGGNCAYCEADYDATAPVDVEHFRPKGAIETDAGLMKPGYWWLAASWDNLLPSCIRCNRKERVPLFDGSELVAGKGNRFPLDDENSRAHEIGGEANEMPLLIDPCREDPADFIRFEDIDERCIAVPVEQDPTSLSARRARASIDIYGLNRAGLVQDRSRYMARAKLLIAQLERAVRRFNRMSSDDGENRRDAELDIAEHLGSLARMTSGEDRFTGILDAVIGPAIAVFNLSM